MTFHNQTDANQVVTSVLNPIEIKIGKIYDRGIDRGMRPGLGVECRKVDKLQTMQSYFKDSRIGFHPIWGPILALLLSTKIPSRYNQPDHLLR